MSSAARETRQGKVPLPSAIEHCMIWSGADPLTMTLASDVPFADGWESGALASISARGRGGGR